MSALEVAKYFILKSRNTTRTSDDYKNMTPLKLQKILYYAQGWYLANSDDPLFKEKIWAWKYGPVVEEVYHRYQRYGSRNLAEIENVDEGTDIDLTPDVKTFLNNVWTLYAKDTPNKLVSYTHNSDPWLKAISNPYSDEITQSSIKKYFRDLID